MKVLLTTMERILREGFGDFHVVSSLEGIGNLDERIEVLVINSYTDSDFELSLKLTQLRDGGGSVRFYYITDNPSTVIKMLLVGIGYYTEDMFYLDSVDDLQSLIDEDMGVGSCDLMVVPPAIEVVQDFVKAFSAGDSRVNTKFYLDRVSNAVNELAVLTQDQHLQIMEMSESAVGLFQRVSEVMGVLDRKRQQLEEQFRELEKSGVSGSRSSFDNVVDFYPTYNYNGFAQLILVREVSPTRYLTSYLLAYMEHIRLNLRKRVKLVIVHQRGAGINKRYGIFPSITRESVGVQDLYKRSVVATDIPKKDVLRGLLETDDYDVIIVLDRLYSRVDIVGGRVRKANAAGGMGDLARYGIRAEDTIFSIVNVDGALVRLPSFSDYPVDKQGREGAYLTYHMKNGSFAKLDERFGLVR